MIPRERWRFVVGPNDLPKLHLETGFEPGRYYRVTYRPTEALVAGAGLAAIRDAAAAFEQVDTDGTRSSMQARDRPNQRPKIF